MPLTGELFTGRTPVATAATFSAANPAAGAVLANGVRTQVGDVFEIEAPPFRLPLRNPLTRIPVAHVSVQAL
jgi:hypothetical protein